VRTYDPETHRPVDQLSADDIELALSAAADIMRSDRAKAGGLDRVTPVGY